MMLGRRRQLHEAGRRMVYRRETPICNLYLTMMEGMGVHRETFGDASGHLPGLTA